MKLADYKELYLTMFQACEARYGDLTEDEEEKDLS